MCLSMDTFLDESCAQVMQLGIQQHLTLSAGPKQHERYCPHLVRVFDKRPAIDVTDIALAAL